MGSLLKEDTWVSGPHFVMGPEEEWPENPDGSRIISPDDPEVRMSLMENAVQAEEGIDAVTLHDQSLLLLDPSEEDGCLDP